jgi:hypothetical protein
MELIYMRPFQHDSVQKPKTSKSSKKLDVVSRPTIFERLFFVDTVQHVLLSCGGPVFICWLVEWLDFLLQEAQSRLEAPRLQGQERA